jgi:hypothetical protein
VPLEDVPQALADLADGLVSGKVAVAVTDFPQKSI